MFNRSLLLGMGAVLAGATFAFSYVRQSEARGGPEAVIALGADVSADAAPPIFDNTPILDPSLTTLDIPVAASVGDTQSGNVPDAKMAALLKQPTPDQGTVVYACPDGKAFGVSYGGPTGDASVTLDGAVSDLVRVPTPTGSQYSDGSMTLHAEGALAAILVGDQAVHDNCEIRHQKDAKADSGAE